MFLHKGILVKVDQFSFYTSNPNYTDNIPFVGKSTTPYEEVGVCFLKDSSSMGNFTFPPPVLLHNEAQITHINMITSSTFEMGDPWKVPSESEMILYHDEISCSPFKLAYVVIQSFSSPSTSDDDEMNMIIDECSNFHAWNHQSMLDPYNKVFLIDEGIMEVMTLDEIPCNDTHHHSTFLTYFDKI